MRTVQEIIDAAYDKAYIRLVEISKDRLKHQKREKNRQTLNKKKKRR